MYFIILFKNFLTPITVEYTKCTMGFTVILLMIMPHDIFRVNKYIRENQLMKPTDIHVIDPSLIYACCYQC